MDIKERYRDIKFQATEIKKMKQKVVDDLFKKKKEILQQYLDKAALDAEAYFNCAHSGDLIAAQSQLDEANLTLTLLRCPDEPSHEKCEGQYYHCQLCGFVWDDTSPAHF